MQQIQLLMNQIMPLLNLYSEIIACLVAASVLSLFAGWMMHRSRARKRMDATNESWDRRYRALEEVSRVDAENLEEQLQNLAAETRALQADKKLLTDSLKTNDSNIQKSRAEAIELNRQHAETQERLQRIIQQKDREIMDIGNRLNQARAGTASTAGSRSASSGASHGSRQNDHDELTHADTVAINGVDMFDATIQIPAEEMLGGRRKRREPWKPGRSDTLDASMAADATEAMDMEEATVALDEESLAYARRSTASRRSN